MEWSLPLLLACFLHITHYSRDVNDCRLCILNLDVVLRMAHLVSTHALLGLFPI